MGGEIRGTNDFQTPPLSLLKILLHTEKTELWKEINNAADKLSITQLRGGLRNFFSTGEEHKWQGTRREVNNTKVNSFTQVCGHFRETLANSSKPQQRAEPGLLKMQGRWGSNQTRFEPFKISPNIHWIQQIEAAIRSPDLHKIVTREQTLQGKKLPKRTAWIFWIWQSRGILISCGHGKSWTNDKS